MSANIRAVDIGGSGLKTAEFTPPGQLVEGSLARFPTADWLDFENWFDANVSPRAQPIGIACAGFVDASRGFVKLFRPGGWIDKPLRTDLERRFPGSTVAVLNDGEAHLLAHGDLYEHPQMCVSLGTAVGFALSNSRGAVVRPSDGYNFDVGQLTLPTRASNNEVWWALGSEGLGELQRRMGDADGAHHFGARLGAFLASLCSVFRPRTVVISGGIVAGWPEGVEGSARAEFERRCPDWLECPRLVSSPYGELAGLWGAAKFSSPG